VPETELTPRQEEIRSELLLVGQERPAPDRALGRSMRERARLELAAVSAGLPVGHKVLANKHRLSQAHTCPGYLRASDGDFAWTVKNVRGRVVHRAIEGLIMSAYRRPPLALAQAAIDELVADDGGSGSAGQLLRELSEGQRQDLVRDVNDVLVKLVADWPPLVDAWLPRVESQARFAVGKVSLRAQFDLALGVPSGSQARTFVVDFKSGEPRPVHRQDARFYAIVDTLRSLTPPYRVATYYLDSGDWEADDVDEPFLEEAWAWVMEGVRRIVAVESGADLTMEPGETCQWCPARDDCADGQEWLAAFGGRRA
jgi:hypothetical protein